MVEEKPKPPKHPKRTPKRNGPVPEPQDTWTDEDALRYQEEQGGQRK